MLSEMIFYIILFLYYCFKTTLPYTWDFCGLQFARSSKLLINNGSYFTVYLAFIYWFVHYTVRYLKNWSEGHFRGKIRFLVYVISISAATQVFWRLFLLTTYFFTCSFYPWFSAAVVVFLNFPSTLSVLTSRGNGLRFMLQNFVEFVKNSYFECFSRGHISSVYSAGTTQIRQYDGRIFNSTEAQPIVSTYSEERDQNSEYQLAIRPPGTRISNGEWSQANSDAPVSSENSAGSTQIRVLDARIFKSTEAQPIVSTYSGESTEHSDYQLVIRPPGTRIPDEELGQESTDAPFSSEYFSGIRILPPPNGFYGTEDNISLGRISKHRQLKQLTETVQTVQKQLTSRQQQNISSSSGIYYPYPSQQSHSKDEIPCASKLSYISKLGLRSKEYGDGLLNDSKYQETGQTSPKQKKEIRISQFEQSNSTAAEELIGGEKVSKRKITTEGKIRSTRKDKKRIGVSESTTGIHRENENFPFRQDFTQNRLPFRTRSGLIYGQLKR